jgi:hypothetical protein
MFKNLIRRLTGKNGLTQTAIFCDSCGEVCNTTCRIDAQFSKAQLLRDRTLGARVNYL